MCCPLPVFTVAAASYRAGCQVAGFPGGPLGSGYHKNWQRLLQKVFMEREKGSYPCLMPKPSLRSFLLFTAPDPTGRPLFIRHFHSQKQVKRPGWKSSNISPHLPKVREGLCPQNGFAWSRAGLLAHSSRECCPVGLSPSKGHPWGRGGWAGDGGQMMGWTETSQGRERE